WASVWPLSFGRDSAAATTAPDGRILVFGGRELVGAGQTKAEAYGPHVQIGASVGAPGDAVVVAGTNFAATATVRIYFEQVPIELASTDAAGTLAPTTFHVPALAPGPHVVRVMDARSLYPITLPFTIQ